MKKFIIGATIGLSLLFTNTVSASEFSDIDNSFAKEEITEFNNLGYFDIFDFENTSKFSPKKNATRGEAISLIVSFGNFELVTEGETPFVDFDVIGEKYKPYVITSYVKGITSGVKEGDGIYFNFDDLITREQFVTLLANYYDVSSDNNAPFKDSDKVSSWASSSVNYFYENGLVIGDDKGYFNPQGYITREEVVIILDRCGDFYNSNVNTVTLYIGSGNLGFSNGTYLDSSLTRVTDIKFDSNMNIIFSDNLSNKIRLASNGKVTDLVGNLNETDFSGIPLGGYVDGKKEDALLERPEKILPLDNGVTLFTEENFNTIRAYDKDEKKVYTLSGSIDSGYKNGALSEALFNKPMGMAQDSKGNIYVADTLNHIIRKIDVKGNVTLLAGSPEISGNELGDLATAKFNEPVDIFITNDDIIYIADSGNNAIKKIENGNVELVAGSKTEINSETSTEVGGDLDGSWDTALFSYPMGIYVVGDDVYVADTQNNKIKLISGGKVTTISGNGNASNFTGSIENATFNSPSSLLVDGNKIYVADTENSMIKLITWGGK